MKTNVLTGSGKLKAFRRFISITLVAVAVFCCSNQVWGQSSAQVCASRSTIDLATTGFYADFGKPQADVYLISAVSSKGARITFTANTYGEHTITYTPAAGFTGVDEVSISALGRGLGISKTVKLFVTVTETPCLPDNVIVAECLGTPPSFQWGISKAHESTVTVSTEVPFVVGDLDGDGKSEIVAFGSNKPEPVDNARTYYPLYVFSHEGQLKHTLKDRSGGDIHGHCDAFGSLALVKLPPPDNRSLIIAANAKDRLLYAYDQNGVIQWVSKNDGIDQQYYSGTAINVGVTDFNCDGWPEIYIGNSIFDAATGQLLVTIPGGYIPNANAPVHNSLEGIFYVAADVLGDGYPQLILGCRIFRVNITSRTGTSGNSIDFLLYSGRHGGHVSIADFDNDGYLDIFVTQKTVTNTGNNNGYYESYLWNPKKNLTSTLPDLWTYDAHRYKNIPMIGDIDGDGQVEVVFFYRREGTPSGGSTNKQIVAYKYNISSSTFSKKWELDVEDLSGSTGLTMFDFNQDGRMELVYRDQTKLRIIDGATKSNLAVFDCSSFTGSEYPIIADIDGDGEAEIIVTGAGTRTGNPGQHGNISIYKSGTNTKWAPARSVWNQYAYNSVNVNNDLTIPRYPYNPATSFSGGDCPSFNGVRRPFNGFLQQQTLLNQYGCPLWILPKIEWTSEPTLAVDNNTITFTGTIKNTGEAGMAAPIYITVYKNSVATANIIKFETLTTSLNKGEQQTFQVVIPDMSSIADLTKIIVNVNDNQTGNPFYQQCNVMASKEMNVFATKEIIAVDDYVSIWECDNVSIDVLANDSFDGAIGIAIVNQGTYGNSVAGSNVVYTSGPNCADGAGKTDVVRYKICYTNDPTHCPEANIYITLMKKPAILLLDSCSVAPMLVPDLQYSGATYVWQRFNTGSGQWDNLTGPTTAEELPITKEGAYRVQVTFNGKTITTAAIKIALIKKATLPGGKIFYQMQVSN